MSEKKEITLGEKRVRTKFNPSSSSMVDFVKQKTAILINLLEEEKHKKGLAEVGRLCALAQTSYEEAGMWAVKAMTIDCKFNNKNEKCLKT